MEVEIIVLAVTPYFTETKEVVEVDFIEGLSESRMIKAAVQLVEGRGYKVIDWSGEGYCTKFDYGKIVVAVE